METKDIAINNNYKLSREELLNLPENLDVFKCESCKLIFRQRSTTDMERIIRISENPFCPQCLTENIEILCKVDRYSLELKLKGIVDCRNEEIRPGVDICPICDQVMCPQCYNHSSIGFSRVTGYLQSVGGWNAGKVQELKDRKRYNIENVPIK